MEYQEKIDLVRTLLAQRDDIDSKLRELLGDKETKPATMLGSAATMPVIKRRGRPAKAKKGQHTCKLCGKPGHNAKTCPAGRGTEPLPRTDSAAEPLTE